VNVLLILGDEKSTCFRNCFFNEMASAFVNNMAAPVWCTDV